MSHRRPVIESLESRTLLAAAAPITATLGNAGAVTVPTSTSRYTFTITYADTAAPVRVSSLGNKDVYVTGPRGYRAPAALASVTPAADAASVVATYFIVPPARRWAVANSGTYTVTVKPRSVFDTANGGNAGALTAGTFAISIPFVNHPPTFRKGPNLAVAGNAGPQTLANWAKKINNPTDKTNAQTLTFLVTPADPSLFTPAGQPRISSDGTLTFTPAPGHTGTTVVTVRLKNSGGTANGGVDTSAPQRFKITLTPSLAPSLT